MAVQPFAKAVRRSSVVSGFDPACAAAATSTGAIVPEAYRYRPIRISPKMLTTKKYVGTAKIRPDSRIPRRFPTVSSTRNSRQSSTR